MAIEAAKDAGGASAWEFAVDLYGKVGVREACLDLQDRLGIDVIAVLALVHRAASGGGSVTPDRLQAAIDAVDAWRRAAVLPLRAVRRALKNWRFADERLKAETDAARAAVAQAELLSERAELLAFAQALASDGHATIAPPDPMGRLGAAAAFLRIYWQVLGLEPEDADRDDLAAVLAAAFPQVAGDAAQAAARGAFRT